jgi:hypothetical protein
VIYGMFFYPFRARLFLDAFFVYIAKGIDLLRRGCNIRYLTNSDANYFDVSSDLMSI